MSYVNTGTEGLDLIRKAVAVLFSIQTDSIGIGVLNDGRLLLEIEGPPPFTIPHMMALPVLLGTEHIDFRPSVWWEPDGSDTTPGSFGGGLSILARKKVTP